MELGGPYVQQHDRSQYLLLIAATPGDILAEALAGEFQRLGWRPLVTDHVEPYALEAQACIVLMSPTSLHSPAVNSALSARPANLIPLVTEPMAPPYAPWAAAPFTFAGSPAQISASINKTLVNLLGPAAPMQAHASYPSGAQSAYHSNYAVYAGGYGSLAPDQGASPPKTGGRSFLFAAIGGFTLLACVIVSLFAIHASQTPTGKASVSAQATATTPLPTPTLAAGFSRYTDPSGNYQINQPTNWRQSVSNGFDLWIAPTHTADLVIGQGDVGAAGASSADIPPAEANAFKHISTSGGGDGSYNNLQGPTTVSLSGETWTQESADIPVHGVTLHGVVVAAEHHQRLYMIGYVGLKSSFASLDAQTFQPMVHSFYFLT